MTVLSSVFEVTSKRIKYGCWIFRAIVGCSDEYVCSVCGSRILLRDFENECPYKYCPYCGSMMLGTSLGHVCHFAKDGITEVVSIR